VAWYAFLVSSVAFATMLAAVSANQILDDGKLTWSWVHPAFTFTLLGLLLTTALQQPPAPDRYLRHPRRRRRPFSHRSVS